MEPINVFVHRQFHLATTLPPARIAAVRFAATTYRNPPSGSGPAPWINTYHNSRRKTLTGKWF